MQSSLMWLCQIATAAISFLPHLLDYSEHNDDNWHTTMKPVLAVLALAAAHIGLVRATPNSVPFSDCTSSQTLSDSRYDPGEMINVTDVYAQIADIGDGKGDELRLTFLAEMGKELIGFANTTKYSSAYYLVSRGRSSV